MAKFKAIVDSKGVMTGYDGCYNIVKAEDFPEGIKSIASDAFKEVSDRYIVELTLPNCVSSIPDSTFEGCRELKSVVLPSSVNYIGRYAFKDCDKLESVVIPEIDTLPDGLFQGCSNLREIDFVRNNPELKVFLSSSNFQISLSESVKNVGDNVFAGCKKIQTIDLNSVKEIGEGAFANCDGLQSITLPYSVTTLLTSTFEGCSKLTSVVIPDSLREIEEKAFAGCEKLKEVSLYIKVNDGKSDTFEDVQIARNIDFAENAFEGCKRLKSFSVRIENIQNMADELKSIAVGKLFDLRNAYFGNLDTSKDGETEKVIFNIPGLPNSYNTSFALFAQFNKLLLTYLRYLEPNHRSTIWVMDELKFKELPSVIFSNILVLPKISGCDKLFMSGSRYIYDQEPELGDPDNGVWLLHPCADWYYSDDQLSEADRNNKDLFFFKEKYREFMHYAHSLGADYYHIDRKNTFNDTNNVTENKGFNVGANADEYGNAKIDRTVKNGNERISDIINEISNDFAWATHEPYTLTRMDIWRGRCWKDIDKMLNSDGKYTEKVKLHDKNTHSQNNSKDLKTQLGIIAKVLNIGTNFDRDKSETQKSDRLDELEINIIVEKGHKPSPEPKPDDSEKKKNELTVPELTGADVEGIYDRVDDREYLRRFLSPREGDTDFAKNRDYRFFNLVALGGMGKSCLIHTFRKNNSNDFDKIVYSLINEDLYKDVVASDVAECCDDIDENKPKESFYKIVKKLQSEKSEKPSLWIIDVNESADAKLIADVMNDWINQKNKWGNWRILIVSRIPLENVDKSLKLKDLLNNYETMQGIFFANLFDEDNPDVCEQYRKTYPATEKEFVKLSDGNEKEILVNKDLKEIFEAFENLPILVAHLAIHLQLVYNGSVMTAQQIKDSISMDDILQEDIKSKDKRGTAEYHYEKINQYLKRLLIFKSLSEERKYILRHLMLWPAVFLSADAIFSLIKSDTYMKNKDNLILQLNKLAKLRILSQDEKRRYKLHGLVADALRDQVLRNDSDVDSKYRDYSDYLRNVEDYKVDDEIESIKGLAKQTREYFMNYPVEILVSAYRGQVTEEQVKEIKAGIEKYESSEDLNIFNCLYFCFYDDGRGGVVNIVHPHDFFDHYESVFVSDFYYGLAETTGETHFYEKWYKLKLIEEVCGIEDHTQKLNKYQEYKDKSSHKIYEDYVKNNPNDFSKDIKDLDFGDQELDELASMIKIESGEFDMGSDENGDEKPIHNVKISSFYIGKYPVTQKLWKWVMGEESLPDMSKRFIGDKRPVIYVNWYDCMDFIIKLNNKTGLQFRLPTEAEWEYAARGGELNEKFKFSGSDDVDEVAWYGEDWDSGSTHDVDDSTKKPNGKGIYGMSGNVWEWCSDWYDSDYYKHSPIVDPQGSSVGSSRVYRGGSWSNDADDCRVAFRFYDYPYYRFSSLGFRLAVSLQFKK